VACRGDSTFASWIGSKSTSTRAFKRGFAAGGYQFVNAGMDGDTAWNVLQRIDAVVRCQPVAATSGT